VRDLLARRWGVTFTLREDVVTVGLAAVEVVKQNPARVSLMLVNDGAFTVQLLSIVNQAGARGPRIDPNGGSLFFWWEEDGELVSQQVIALANGNFSGVRVYETIIEGLGPEPTAGVT